MPKPTIEELAEHAGEGQCQSRHRNGSRCIRPAGHYAAFTEADDTQRRIGRKHRGGPNNRLFWEDNEAMTEPTDEQAAIAEKEARHARRDEIREIMREMLDEMLHEREDRARQHDEDGREERSRYERDAALKYATEALAQVEATSAPVVDWVLDAARRYAKFIETGEITA